MKATLPKTPLPVPLITNDPQKWTTEALPLLFPKYWILFQSRKINVPTSCSSAEVMSHLDMSD